MNLQPKELEGLNSCRFFLQVITVSDITDGSGTKIMLDHIQGRRCPDCTSTLRWPQKAPPSMLAWLLCGRTWSTRCLWCVNQATYHLRINLGPWIPQVRKHQEWTYHMDMSNKRLIKQTKEGIFLVHSAPMPIWHVIIAYIPRYFYTA